MSDSVVIIGYSGHAYVVIETARLINFHVTGYCEQARCARNPYDLLYLGSERDEGFDWVSERFYFVGIGDNRLRARLAELVHHKGGQFINIVHPTSWLSETAEIGKGVFINTNVSVNALAYIGDQCILNTACVIEHECRLGEFVHVGPGAVLLGDVKIGQFSFIGANAVVKQGVTIGANAIIGAGAVVIRDVADGEIVVGNPAQKIN